MPKLNCFEHEGLYLFFNSLDHPPPHFHAMKPGKWEIRIFFETCTDKLLDYQIKWSKGKCQLDKKTKLEIVKLIAEHRDALLMQWNNSVCH